MFKYKKVLLFVNRAVYLMCAAMLMAGYRTNGNGSTGKEQAVVRFGRPHLTCQSPQDANQYDHGATVYIHGENFDPSTSYGWSITGQPGGASGDPGATVASGSESTDAAGTFCFAAYTIANDDWGTYTVDVDDANKNDNYRVNGEPPVMVDVCHVPGYTTESMTQAAWDTLHATDPDDFLIDATHPCTPPIVYIPVCDVPTSSTGTYSTIQVAEGDLAAWLLAHPEDHQLAAGETCAPTLIDVCLVPGYTTAQVDELFLDEYLAAHEGSFVADDEHPCTAPSFVQVCDVPSYEPVQIEEDSLSGYLLANPEDFLITSEDLCEPEVAYCHYDEGTDLWTELTGYESELIDPDYVLPDGESCPVKVTVCIYDAQANLWTQESDYEYNLVDPDYVLPDGEACPVKVAFCHYTEEGPYGETWTQDSNYPDQIIKPDFVLGEGEACPQPLAILDPYCFSIPGNTMQWEIDNPNADVLPVTSWEIDSVAQSGFDAAVGTSLLTTTPLGTHTVDLFWGITGHSSLEWTIESCAGPTTYVNVCHMPGYVTDVMSTEEWDDWKVTHTDDFLIDSAHPCQPPKTNPLPLPTGAGGELIPVTGADMTPFTNIWVFAGFGMFGFGMVLTGLRKRLER